MFRGIFHSMIHNLITISPKMLTPPMKFDNDIYHEMRVFKERFGLLRLKFANKLRVIHPLVTGPIKILDST